MRNHNSIATLAFSFLVGLVGPLTLVIAAVLISPNTLSAQANVSCGLSTPLGSTPRASSTGHTEPIAGGPPIVGPGFELSPPTAGGGILRVTCSNTGATGTPGVVALTISLGAPITNTTSHPHPAHAIRIINRTGDFDSLNVGINSINNAGGAIVIGLGTAQPSPTTGITFTSGTTSSFDLAGVLVSTNGRSTPVTAGLTSNGGVTISLANVQVIDSVMPSFSDPSTPGISFIPGLPPGGGPAIVTQGGNVVKGNFTLRIQENYPDAFRSWAQFNGGGVFPQSPASSTHVMASFTSIPPGLAITNCSAVLTDVFGNLSFGIPQLSATNIIPAAPLLTVVFTDPLSLSNIDVLWLTCSVGSGTAVLPLPLTPVTVQLTMEPIGAALGPSGNPLTTLITGQVPRYQLAMQPATPVPVVLFPPDPNPATLPAITGMTPSVGSFGRTVNAVITGRNFGTVTDVWFGGSSPGVVAMIGSGRTDTSLPVTITILPQAVDGPYIVTVVGSTGPSEGFSAFTVRGTTPLAWGSNITGQFARPNPQTNLSPRPVVNLGPGSAISVAAGSSHNLALSADGTVWAWGSNTSGQLGDGTTIPRLSPVQVSGLGPGSGVVAIAAGNVYSLALKMDGTVLAWGSNTTGQLGDGSTTTRLTPVQVNGLGGSGVVKIAASFGGVLGAHSLALKSDGTVVAWGLNSNGQLGDGTTTQRLSPVPITALGAGVADIAAGSAHSLARKSDGSVFAWGLNSGGQLGDGTLLQRNTPVPVSTLGSNSGVLFLAGSQLHSLALKSDGTVLAWGTNSSGQLGDGSFVQKLTPVPVSDPSGIGMLTGVLSISAGNLYSLALKSDHTAYGWGANSSGTLGTGNTIGSPIPVPVGGSTPIGGLMQVAAAISHSLALTQDGIVLAWGSNSNGQLGNGSFDGSAVPVGIDVFNNSSPSPTAIASSSGGAQSALAKLDGSVSTWGGSSTSTTPVPVNSLPPVPTLALAVGSGITGSHMLALKSDGTVYAWGTNTSGQLGDGTAISRTNAMPVGVPVGMIAVAAGSSHSLALHSDGTVWGWGSNSNGQLGDGTIQSRSIPSPILGLTGVAAIAAGGSLSFALRSDGTLWAWGINTFGQLGDGTTTIQRTVPVQVRDTTGLTFLTGVAAIVAGGSHTLAEKSDGTVLAWGLNTNGQLGDGTIVSKSLPTPVSGLGVGSGIIKLAAGGVHSLALKSNGALWAWGGNASGQLGDGTLENRRTPVQVLTNDVLGIAAGSAHSLALASATSSDTTPPVITPNISGTTGTNGWYRSNVTVAWDISDPESGITSTSGCFPTTLTIETSGITLLCSAADGAGLAISASVTIKIDKTAPVVSSTRTTVNANGWNKGDVLVHFSATDALSGISGSASLDRNISTEGINQSAIATFTDVAGNSFTARVDGINIDKTRPIASANATPAPNANGWNNTDVAVTFTGVDNLSGIASCSAPVLITTEGQNQSASGTCTDLADNVSAPATATINIDNTAPAISGMPALNCTIWPPNKQFVEIAAIKATDDAAGVAPGSLTIAVTSNEPVDPTDIVVQDGVVQVRADRLGDSTDRIYTINARVSDLAGNAMNVEGSCIVPHDQAN